MFIFANSSQMVTHLVETEAGLPWEGNGGAASAQMLNHHIEEALSVIKISSRRFLGADKSEFRHPVRSLDT
jgi:hypothetical protein